MYRLPSIHNQQASVRVLVVDDEEHVRELTARWLRDAGYECRCANGVAQALQILAQGSVDVVATDITMPDETGSAWIRRLRRAYADTAIVVLTGCDDARTAIEAFKDGACDYLIKPVSQAEFLEQIQRAVEHCHERACERRNAASLEQRLHDATSSVQAAHDEAAERLILASAAFRQDELARLQRIGLMSALVAEAWNRSPHEVDAIRRAAPLHDIGKPATLPCCGERAFDTANSIDNAVKDHAIIGAGILTGSRLFVLRMAEQIARSHHERWDGLGAPDGLQGEQIPWPARIVALVDAYDEMTHDQPYRLALSEEEAMQAIEDGAAGRFDPALVPVFRAVWPQLRQEVARIGACCFATGPWSRPETITNTQDQLAALLG